MGREKGSRWDVGTRDNAITLERFDDGDERVSEDVLEVEEARALAALLTKHADKLESSDRDKSSDSDKSSDDEKSSDDDESDDSDDSEKSEKSDSEKS
ncbi:hypothetical protein [Mycolicibacterium monacense]|uniref:Uncharacterized protein n=2 Tax=unclassified Mycobacterium TaxID=2642494 RepID=A0A5Q5BMA9_MYCSS|nr:hypothetical protein [Mycolicibacterium monacense]OBF52171.1 hypothetical protein A5778_13490 [Mycolicibacterium monacense]